jgi:hypothetical protein
MIMSFEIEIYNQYGLDEKKKYNLCPVCSHTRRPKNQKQRCLMTNWERGLATCQHCHTVLQLHKYKGVKNDFLYYVPEPNVKPQGSFHPIEFLDEVVSKYIQDESYFSKYLERFFSREQIFEAEQKLLIFSTNDFYQKSICYPYINENEKITGIKVMAYNPYGNRLKNKRGNGIVNWMHSIYKIKDWVNDFCFFGLEQISKRSERVVHIFESEKTAFVMTIVKPELICMATGGLTVLTKKKLEPLRNYKIVLHPDKGDAFIIWSQYANHWKEFDIIVSRITEDNPRVPDKGDIADYFLHESKLIIAPPSVPPPQDWQQMEDCYLSEGSREVFRIVQERKSQKLELIDNRFKKFNHDNRHRMQDNRD